MNDAPVLGLEQLEAAETRPRSQFEAKDYGLKNEIDSRKPNHPVGIPWVVALGFVRLPSNPAVVERPDPPAELWQNYGITIKILA